MAAKSTTVTLALTAAGHGPPPLDAAVRERRVAKRRRRGTPLTSRRRQSLDEPHHLARLADRREHERRDPRLGERLQALALGAAVAEHEHLADEVVGDELERALAVAVLPRRTHRLDPLAPPEPAEERGVDGDGRVGDEHPARGR